MYFTFHNSVCSKQKKKKKKKKKKPIETKISLVFLLAFFLNDSDSLLLKIYKKKINQHSVTNQKLLLDREKKSKKDMDIINYPKMSFNKNQTMRPLR